MELHFTIPGTIEVREEGKIISYENIETKLCVNFHLEEDGEIVTSACNRKFWTTLWDYNETTDQEIPRTFEFEISQVKMKGNLKNSVMPDSYFYDYNTKTLILKYF
jgi:hypothetical protein